MLSRRYPAILSPFPKPDAQPLVIPPQLDPSCVLALLPLRDNKWHDYSGFNNHGIMTNSYFLADSTTYPGVYFNGSDGIVTIPDSPSLDIKQSFTFEILFRPFGVQAKYAKLLCKNDTTLGHSWGFDYSDDGKKIRFFVLADLAVFITTTTEHISGISYLTGTYDGAICKFYVNGIFATSRLNTGDMVGSGNVGIGALPRTPPVYFFNGLVFFAFVHNRVLSADEILANSKLLLPS